MSKKTGSPIELCPLRFTSNNAPPRQKILGTVLLSILAGHKRSAHITTRLRMLLNVDVQAGNQIASEYPHVGLWDSLDARPREQWPVMLRGDIAWGTEKTMCERRSPRAAGSMQTAADRGRGEASGGIVAAARMEIRRRWMARGVERIAVAGVDEEAARGGAAQAFAGAERRL